MQILSETEQESSCDSFETESGDDSIYLATPAGWHGFEKWHGTCKVMSNSITIYNTYNNNHNQ